MYHPQSAADIFGEWRMQTHEVSCHAIYLPEDDIKQNASQNVGSMASNADTGLPMPRQSSDATEHSRIQEWLKQRLGTRTMFMCMVTFIILDAALQELEAVAVVPEVSSQSITVAVNLATLVVALTVSFAVDGREALRTICNHHYMWRWFIIAVLFMGHSYLHAVGVDFDVSEAWVLMLVYANVPIALAISLCMFKRIYGRLEWLSVAMMTLGMATFVLIRFRCGGTSCHELQMVWDSNHVLGISCILVSVFVQVMAWTLTERLLKAKSRGLVRVHGYRCRQRVYIMMVHFSFWQLVVNSFTWSYHSIQRTGNILDGERQVLWFGDWSIWQSLLVLAYVGHLWCTGIVIKRFSTVVWALMQIVTRVLAYPLSDLATRRGSIEATVMLSLMIAPIVVLSAIMFQTGRLNLSEIKKALDLRESEPEPGGWMDSLKALVSPPLSSECGRSGKRPHASSVSLQLTFGSHQSTPPQTSVVVEEPEPGRRPLWLEPQPWLTPTYSRSDPREENVEMQNPRLHDEALEAEQAGIPLDSEQGDHGAVMIDGVFRLSAGLDAAECAAASSGSSTETSVADGGEAMFQQASEIGDTGTEKDVLGRHIRLLAMMWKYSAVIAYILSQALRENLSQKVCSSRIVVPQSLNVATSLCTLLLAIGTTLFSHGREGLMKACDFRKFLKTLLCSLLFALAAFLGSLAFAFGTSAAAKDAAGRVYTPVAALLSRWIMGKFYIWLEWLALVILTLSFVTFGLIDVMGGSMEATPAGLLCAIGAGTVSAVNSLFMEKIMKTEADPFVVQNIRLSMGNLIFSIGFLWVSGWIGESESPPRNDFATWAYRPTANECISIGSCSDVGTFLPTLPLVEVDFAESCSCGKGFFVGWGNTWVLYAALASSVIYSWVTGVVVKQFSSVYRSIADGITLLVVYFLLTPILDQTAFPPPDLAKSFVVLIIPLSGTTFSYAASEMQAVVEAVESTRTSDLVKRGDDDLADLRGDDPETSEAPAVCTRGELPV